jgi:hypothetical protein
MFLWQSNRDNTELKKSEVAAWEKVYTKICLFLCKKKGAVEKSVSSYDLCLAVVCDSIIFGRGAPDSG